MHLKKINYKFFMVIASWSLILSPSILTDTICVVAFILMQIIVPILEMVDRAERGRGWVLGSLGCRARVNLDILLSAGGSDPQ